MDKSFKKNIDIYNDVTLLIVCYNSELLIKKNIPLYSNNFYGSKCRIKLKS